MVLVFTMIKMALFTMVNGMRTKNVEKGKCFSLMDLSMMDNGRGIKCMVKVSLFLVQETDLKVIFVMASRTGMELFNTIMVIIILDNGGMILYGVEVNSNLRMETIMKETL